MMEAATGVMFLMSSLYGAGQANAQSVPVTSTISSSQATATADIRPLTDQKEIEAYIRKELASKPILIEIARCESTFRQYGKDGKVIRGLENPLDVGVMQINEHYHADTAKRLGYDLYTVEGNIAYGKYLYSKYGTSPWVHSSSCWAGADLAELTYK
jgi:soluble lytic murein transglycosylase-like protein